jgi:3-hydroxyisobutyrate dehydrogenase-like beta-hydroxyacid dehydrogenase
VRFAGRSFSALVWPITHRVISGMPVAGALSRYQWGMPTVGIVSPGQMGAALGGALRSGGARVVTTLEGRSDRSRRLAEEAGLEVLPTLAEVVAVADVVLSVTPPAAALETARRVARAAPPGFVFADLNAVSPVTMAAIAEVAGPGTVDGSISGPPPSVRPGARVYLSGAHAPEVAALPWNGAVEPIVIDGSASALKMCTGSVYKGLTALLTQALRTAGAHGVLDAVVDDLGRNGFGELGQIGKSAPKAHRFVAEMREVSATQAAAGLTPDLFAAIAQVYEDVATTRLAEGNPETAPDLTPAEMVQRLHGR